MKKELLSSIVIGGLICIFGISLRARERIQSVFVNKGSVTSLYLSPGLVSTVIFPCPVREFVTGRAESVTVAASKTNKKEIFLSLTEATSSPTNLIVSCENAASPFVFDVLPSNGTHFDVYLIRASFGGPEITGAGLTLTDSSDKKQIAPPSINQETKDTVKASRVITIQKPSLIEEN